MEEKMMGITKVSAKTVRFNYCRVKRIHSLLWKIINMTYFQLMNTDYVSHVEKTKEMRKEVQKRSAEQAESMLANSIKRMKKVIIGATVKIRIPDVDRGRTDHLKVLGVIMDVQHDLCTESAQCMVFWKKCILGINLMFVMNVF